ncbi:MAG: ABC transporter permease subunit [Anaerolineales bacterium]|nr:ABC transporter permease subunit [Anaerolineales bacterium]
MSETIISNEIREKRTSPIQWFFNNARWHGAEWWIMIFGGVLLVFIIFMTIFADRLAVYDPIKFVGAPFNRPNAKQSIVLLESNNNIDDLQDLFNNKVGVIVNTQAAREMDALGVDYENFSLMRLALESLRDGQIEALVTDWKDPKFQRQIDDYDLSLKVVGEPFGTSFILGTDNYGRDVFSRIIHGAKTVLAIAILAALMSASVGVPVGLLSGFYGGILDRVLSLIMDSMYSFPGLILAIAMAALLGPGMLNIAVAIAVIYIPVYYRLVRSRVLSVKEELYVEAAKSLGAKAFTILWLYVFPNVIPSIVVIFSVNVADSILTEAGLSFLGLGLPPPTPDWGFDLSAGKRFVPSGYWWIITYPGMMIALLTLGFSMLGEGLNEILNPRLAEN